MRCCPLALIGADWLLAGRGHLVRVRGFINEQFAFEKRHGFRY